MLQWHDDIIDHYNGKTVTKVEQICYLSSHIVLFVVIGAAKMDLTKIPNYRPLHELQSTHCVLGL